MNDHNLAFVAVIGIEVFLIIVIAGMLQIAMKYFFKFDLAEWIFAKTEPHVNPADEFECNDTRRPECWDCCKKESKPQNKSEVQL